MAGKQHVTNNATTLIVSACSFCCRPAKSCHWRCSTKPTACTGHTHTHRQEDTDSLWGCHIVVGMRRLYIILKEGSQKLQRRWVCCMCVCVCELATSWGTCGECACCCLVVYLRQPHLAHTGKLRQTYTSHTHRHIYKLTLTHCYTHIHFIRFV